MFTLKDKFRGLNAKILAIESDEWYKIKSWLHENNILDCNHQKKVSYYNFCDVLNESKRFNKKLTIGQLIKAREMYIILEDAGYDFVSSKERKEDKQDRTFRELKSFDSVHWKALYDWSNKKLLIQYEDHKLLDPLVNGNSIDNMEESDLIDLSNLYNRLVEKGFREDSNVLEGKIPEVLEEITQLDEKELLEEVKSFKYDEWNQMFEWAMENKKFKNKDLSLLTGLAIRSSNKELSQNELLLGLEVYFILMSEGFELIKEKDVDDFLMQFMDESESIEKIQGEYKTNKLKLHL